MMNRKTLVWNLFVLAAGAFVTCAIGQDQPEPKPQTETVVKEKSNDKATVERAIEAVVTEVKGTVEFAKAGVSVLEKDGWSAVKVDDKLSAGAQIRTGLRSSVTVRFGETTYMSLRSATHASLDQLYRSANTEVVRVGLGYGTVRGGSTEGEIRANVIVDSPVATLAKRGTEGWQMEVEPVTGRFNISLSQHGLVEAIRKVRDEKRSSRVVRPGEYVTDSTIANLWIKQNIFDRAVTFFDTSSVSTTDAEFNAENSRGYGVMAPGGGSSLVGLSGRASSAFVNEQLDGRNPTTRPPSTIVIQPGILGRPEGNFGTPSTFRVLTAQGR
ncbi:MAG: hypothetical protein AABZ47_05260 [Planctomycetota bacterium]